MWPPQLRFRPIGNDWPGELTKNRKWSPFSASLSETTELLGRELRQLKATQPVIQLALTESQLRLDGMPRSGVKPEHPGVILTFDVPKVGSVRLPTDRFTAWADNLRAVALGMEAMRKVERYGIVRDNQQYRGWKAIEGGMSAMATDVAKQVIEDAAGTVEDGWSWTNPADVRALCSRAVRLSHPDYGGTAELFQQVMAARKVLRDAHIDGVDGVSR